MNFTYGVNKMDRSPYTPWAFIYREYHFSEDEANSFGTIWFYELDTDTKTLLTIPQGRWRGPFAPRHRRAEDQRVRAVAHQGLDGQWLGRETGDPCHGGGVPGADQGDWTSYIATAGIHADMSDLGVDAGLQPVFLGSDGGLFKPRPAGLPGPGDWVSAAVPGSGMNSLQITDLAGTNIVRPDGAVLLDVALLRHTGQQPLGLRGRRKDVAGLRCGGRLRPGGPSRGPAG